MKQVRVKRRVNYDENEADFYDELQYPSTTSYGLNNFAYLQYEIKGVNSGKSKEEAE
jgi:hypothetical protein